MYEWNQKLMNTVTCLHHYLVHINFTLQTGRWWQFREQEKTKTCSTVILLYVHMCSQRRLLLLLCTGEVQLYIKLNLLNS